MVTASPHDTHISFFNCLDDDVVGSFSGSSDPANSIPDELNGLICSIHDRGLRRGEAVIYMASLAQISASSDVLSDACT